MQMMQDNGHGHIQTDLVTPRLGQGFAAFQQMEQIAARQIFHHQRIMRLFQNHAPQPHQIIRLRTHRRHHHRFFTNLLPGLLTEILGRILLDRHFIKFPFPGIHLAIAALPQQITKPQIGKADGKIQQHLSAGVAW